MPLTLSERSAMPAQPAHDHPPGRDGGHDHGHSHDHAHPSTHHVHSHGPGRGHPPAVPPFSLLRLSLAGRVAIAVPLAALLWALTLAVLFGGGA